MSAETSSKTEAISDELADLVLAAKERGVSCPPNCDYQTHQRAEVRAELEAALPAIRQQVAEEIATAVESHYPDLHAEGHECQRMNSN